MCSIAAFSFSKNSKFDARKLASALLIAGEKRGTHASGYAYSRGDIGIVGESAAERASKFVRTPRFDLPSSAKVVLLHTRYATQGKPENNLNNHPVFAFGDSDASAVAAVHNGCIWNDFTLFRQYKADFERIAEVDSEIIPQLLLHKGSDKYAEVLGEIKGSVATAWLDERTGDTLHVARATDSPVQVALIDEPKRTSRRGNRRNRLHGVIIASTFEMLQRGLNALGLSHDGRYVQLYTLAEGQYMSVTDGQWDQKVYTFELPKGGTGYSWEDYADEWSSDWSRWTKRTDNIRMRQQYNRPAGTPRYTGGTTSTNSQRREDATYAFTEGYDAQTGNSYVSHHGYLRPAPDELEAAQYLSDYDRGDYPDGNVLGPREPSADELFEMEHRQGLDSDVEFTVTTPQGESQVVTLSDILAARDNGTLSEAEAEVFMHLEFCEEDQCILLDPSHCPVYENQARVLVSGDNSDAKQAHVLVSNPVHNRRDRDIVATADQILSEWNQAVLQD